MSEVTLSPEAARRYVLGRQGLWPGRRWAGKAGADAAIRQMEAVQVDTISVVARNHDLVLWSRVADYRPADLDALLYQDRAFFDYGGVLMIYPAAELPYWRAIMRWWTTHRQAHAPDVALLDRVREELRARGPLGNRDFAAEGPATAQRWRSGKATGQALYYLWRTGELMTHSRRGFDRVYDFHHNVAPPPDGAAPPETDLTTAVRYFAGKTLRDLGLATRAEWTRRSAIALAARVSPVAAGARGALAALVEAGEAAPVRVAGLKEPRYAPAADLPLLAELAEGRTPACWQPLATTTDDEVTFLAPLDNVIWDRARTRALFDFEYIWEVYKPAPQRRWGYYTMPILYGDRLVGRLNPKLDRRAGVLTIDGFWLEDAAPTQDEAFVAALARGLARFARFHDATLDLAAIAPARLRQRLDRLVKRAL